MAFSSFVFLFLFFPLSVLLYYLPGRPGQALNIRRKVILLALSLIFYAWGEPKRIALLLLSLALNYLLLRLQEKLFGKRAKILLAAGVLLNLLVLIWGKYLAASLPLGLSFYTFKLLSAWFDRYKARRADETNGADGAGTAGSGGQTQGLSCLDFALYIAFFPQLISGPIARFADFLPQLTELKADLANLSSGLRRFLPGLFIKVLLADGIYGLWLRLAGPDAVAAPALAEAWLASFFYAFYIYLDFSSYSDMAIGLGTMFGFQTKENFRQPYRAVSITDFWRRWHISLSSWFRDYVYIPLGGNRKGKARQVLNILAVWLLTGIWHGSSLNFLFWGLYYAVWLLLEKFFLAKRAERWPEAGRRLLTFLIVNLGWVLFAFPKWGELKAFAAALCGQAGVTNGQAAYLLLSHSLLIVLAALFAADVPAQAAALWQKSRLAQSPAGEILHYAAYTVLLLISLAFIVDQSFSSFLYFNF